MASDPTGDGKALGITKFEDSKESGSPPLKKSKTDPKAKASAEAEEEVQPEIRILRRGDWDDPEYAKQRIKYEKEFEKSEGYDVEWDDVVFDFPALRFEWAGDLDLEMSNKELMKLLIQTAIKEENEETGTKLEHVKYVSANIVGAQGFLFYITFWAKDLSLPNPEPKLYQAQVRKFADEIFVNEFRLRPTQIPYL